ncbi:hypothetical protein ACI6QG_05085 [Roseococcus sp. DSY-14]|uniref:hypothetical protein n=1 Tax=Roseococcus sp. DSY-14 TaxID=3369650 RepID=UPI00387B5694
MTLSTGMLGLFMMALALLPVVLVWRDARGKAQEARRLAALRQDARVTAELRRRAPVPALQWTGAGR